MLHYIQYILYILCFTCSLFFLLTQTVTVCNAVCLKRADSWGKKMHHRVSVCWGRRRRKMHLFDLFLKLISLWSQMRQGFTPCGIEQYRVNQNTVVLVSSKSVIFKQTFTHKHCHFIFTLVLKMCSCLICVLTVEIHYPLNLYIQGNTPMPDGVKLF